MTTLLTILNSRGSLGRCDENCYDAKGPNCNCICGGLNHGKGRQEAARLTLQYVYTILRQNEATHPEQRPFKLKRAPNLFELAHPTFFEL